VTRIFGLTGWSGSGKTTLIIRLLPVLTARGLKVSTIKHTHHDFAIDKPGKDSWRHRESGAGEVLIAGPARWALIHEHRGAPEPPLAELLRRMAPADLVLVEGFGSSDHPKLEVHRPSLGKTPVWPEERSIIAVASDEAIAAPLPLLPLDDTAAIADFILAHARPVEIPK
jgi:molybdopterin-guanine dinucleotide biosynthesis adapter protein